MKTKIRKVYYCDFCKKHSLHSIAKHEEHCTVNPNRKCRLCGRTDTLQPLIDKYKSQMDYKIIKNTDNIEAEEIQNRKQPKLEDILSDTESMDGLGPCPICTFAIIRQIGLNKFPFTNKFDFQKELKEWWEGKNAAEETYDL